MITGPTLIELDATRHRADPGNRGEQPVQSARVPCWPADVLAELGEWAAARGLIVISDECYDQLWLDRARDQLFRGRAGSPAITVFSLSKSYAMTGWRVGYAHADTEIIALMTRVQETTTSSVNTPSQYAALAALTGPQEAVGIMRSAYRARRDAALAHGGDVGFVGRPPDRCLLPVVDFAAECRAGG